MAAAGAAEPASSGAATIMAVFLAQAVAGGSLMTRIADIQQGLGLDEAQLGLALSGGPVGGLASFLVSGAIVGRLGTRHVLLWGIPAIALLTLAMGIAPDAVTLFLAGAVHGVVFSLTNVAMNVEADRVEALSGIRVMNRCHGLWSAGLLLTALTGVLARGMAVPVAVHFALLVPPVVLAVWWLVMPMRPAPERPGTGQGRAVALPTRATVLLMAFGLAGGVVQAGAQNWSVILMRDSYAVSDWIETMALPLFLLALTLGRMFADGWNVAFGSVRVTRVLAWIALLGCALVMAPVHWMLALAGFAAMGLGICGLFPLMVSAAAKIGDRPAAENVSSVIMITGLVMLAVPSLMGVMAESWGIRAAFALAVPSLLLTLAVSRRALSRA